MAISVGVAKLVINFNCINEKMIMIHSFELKKPHIKRRRLGNEIGLEIQLGSLLNKS